jgi:hypothetical protein
VHAAAAAEEVDAYLSKALLGGPVTHVPRVERYYVLVPADTATPWRAPHTERLGRDSYFGVPRTGLTAHDPEGWRAY